MKAIKNDYKGEFMDWTCPKCNEILHYFEDGVQSYMYCASCEDYAYDIDTGEDLGKLDHHAEDNVLDEEAETREKAN